MIYNCDVLAYLWTSTNAAPPPHHNHLADPFTFYLSNSSDFQHISNCRIMRCPLAAPGLDLSRFTLCLFFPLESFFFLISYSFIFPSFCILYLISVHFLHHLLPLSIFFFSITLHPCSLFAGSHPRLFRLLEDKEWNQNFSNPYNS